MATKTQGNKAQGAITVMHARHQGIEEGKQGKQRRNANKASKASDARKQQASKETKKLKNIWPGGVSGAPE